MEWLEAHENSVDILLHFPMQSQIQICEEIATNFTINFSYLLTYIATSFVVAWNEIKSEWKSFVGLEIFGQSDFFIIHLSWVRVLRWQIGDIFFLFCVFCVFNFVNWIQNCVWSVNVNQKAKNPHKPQKKHL